MTHAILPWPPKELSPNARVHWARKATVVKYYKEACIFWLRKSEPFTGWARKRDFVVTFHAPDNRRRDRDNIISAFKSGQDALSFVTGVDDNKFNVKYIFASPVQGGAVRVEAI